MSLRALIEGRPALLVLPPHERALTVIASLLESARAHDVPIVFGFEPTGDLRDRNDRAAREYRIRPPRYSAFLGTELPFLLRELDVSTLILAGGQTSLSVHYSFLDAHQHDYFCRVAEDSMQGSSPPAHLAALRAMEYMQTGARRDGAQILAALNALASSGRVAGRIAP